ncbi:MAG TPA: BrnA antitoxin family protein [Paracoccaceae bacterium]|nr:BrnA antitoxin family protein [Paracoccaceae bacterium]
MAGSSRKPLIDKRGEARSLQDEDLAVAVRVGDHPSLEAAVKAAVGKRRAAKEAWRVEARIRLDPGVLAHYRSAGPDWEDEISRVLRKAAGSDPRLTPSGSGP